MQSHFITALIGHLFNSIIVFVALFTFGWSASFALTYLHQIHPFPEDMLRFVMKLEMGLIYMDASISSLLLIVGAVRFCRKVVRSTL